MFVKVILVFCTQALFMQSATSQCTSRAAVSGAPGIAAPAFAAPYRPSAPALSASYGISAPASAAPCGFSAPAMDFTPITVGTLSVTSSSAVPPVGISVVSENVYEGVLAAAGEVPFVGSTAVEGIFPTTGAGAINHDCGNGINAMVSEPAALAPGYLEATAPAATAIAPLCSVAPASVIAPGLAAPSLGYAGWPGRDCGYAF